MFQKTIMDNRIRVITETIPEYRSIAMGFLIDGGLKDEQPGKYGLAHVVEHMMFQGTQSRNATQIAKFMDESGGYVGAFTARDYTCYSAIVLDDYRTYVLELIGDILLNSIFPIDRLEKEKKAILREIDAAYDIPDQRVEDNLKRYIWGDHPLGRLIAGNPDSIRSIIRDDIISFVSSNYVTDRLIIAAAGHVNHIDFIGQVQDAFWRMPTDALKPVRDYSKILPKFSSGVSIEYSPVSQTYFSIGIRSYPFADEHRYGMHLLNNILGGGMSSRLFCRLREDFGIVYDISSEYQAYQDDGILVIKGSTSSEYLKQVLELTLLEITKLFSEEEPINEDELWKAKMYLRGQHMISSESTHTRMSRLLTQELYFGRQMSTEEIMNRIDVTEKNELYTICRQMIHALKEVSLAIVGPKNESEFDKSSIEQILDNFKTTNLN